MRLFEQINEICYYGNNISYEEAYKMPVRYRNFVYLKINDFKKKEIEQVKKQQGTANSKFPTGKPRVK